MAKAKTYDEQLAELTKKSEALKKDMTSAKDALDKAKADYTAAEPLQEKNEAKEFFVFDNC